MKLDCKRCGHSLDLSHSTGQGTIICPTCGGEVDSSSQMPEEGLRVAPPELPILNERAKSKNRTIWYLLPVIVSVCAIAAFMISAFISFVVPAEEAKLHVAVATAIGFVLGGFVVTFLLALLVAAPIAGLMVLFKKNFLRSLSVSYSIVAILIVANAMIGANFVSKNPNSSSFAGISSLNDHFDQRRAADALQKDVESMLEESVGPDGLPRKIESRFVVDSSPKNDSERTVRMMHQYFNEVSDVQNQYIQALEDDGLNSLLDAERLLADENFSESREIIVRAKKSVAKGRAKNDEVLNNFPDRVEKEPLDSKLKKGIIAGFNERLKEIQPLYAELWDLELKSVERLEEMVDHIEATRDQWEVEDGMIVFQKEKDLETFNKILDQINAGAKRQEEIRRLLTEKR